MVEIHAVPAFKDNYIWVLADGGRAAVVDPGESAPVERFLEQNGLELTAILATHHHGDHVGGVPALFARWKCPVFGPARETIPDIEHRLVEGDRITVPGLGLALSVLDIPAHTAGHIAYYLDSEATAFVGDTLFAMGCGRLFEGTAEQMHSNLQRLSRLPPDTLVYCAHEYTLSNGRFALTVEPDNAALVERMAGVEAARAADEPTVPTTIALERATNPFMRAASAEEFAARRAAKDAFR